jgi:hypothetical protein
MTMPTMPIRLLGQILRLDQLAWAIVAILQWSMTISRSTKGGDTLMLFVSTTANAGEADIERQLRCLVPREAACFQ